MPEYLSSCRISLAEKAERKSLRPCPALGRIRARHTPVVTLRVAVRVNELVERLVTRSVLPPLRERVEPRGMLHADDCNPRFQFSKDEYPCLAWLP